MDKPYIDLKLRIYFDNDNTLSTHGYVQTIVENVAEALQRRFDNGTIAATRSTSAAPRIVIASKKYLESKLHMDLRYGEKSWM